VVVAKLVNEDRLTEQNPKVGIWHAPVVCLVSA
jgi:hypothetical protein